MAIHIIKGSAAPTDAPPEVGCHFIDQTNEVVYQSVGTTSAADWIQLGGSSSTYTTFKSLLDTPAAYGTAGQVPAVNSAEDGLEFVDQAAGVTEFTGLTDTPANYPAGSAGKVTAVNTGETALEFVDQPTVITAFIGLSDTPSSYPAGSAGKVATVNTGETALEFLTPDSSPLTTQGDLVYRDASTITRLPLGASGNILTSDGTDAAWAAPTKDYAYTDYITGLADPAASEGRVFWDKTNKSLAYHTDIAGTTIQVAQEQVVRVVNNTGSTIANGKVVYISGAQGDRPTVTLAQANADTSDNIVGLVTSEILNNAEGFVTINGVVRGFNTSGFTAGDKLYVSPTTAGELTNTEPVPPLHTSRVGYALNSTVSGSVLVDVRIGGELTGLHDVALTGIADTDLIKYDSDTGTYIPYPLASVTAEPTGFADRTATLGIATRLVTLAHPFSYWYKGKLFESTVDATWTVPNTTGLYFLLFTDGVGTAPTPTTTFYNLEDQVPVAIAYWNATTSENFLGEERHGLSMDWATHEYLHLTRGAVYESGGTLGGYTLDSDALTDIQMSISATSYWDEDIQNINPEKAKLDNWYKWYRSGATGEWGRGGTTGTIPAFHATNIPKYNQWTGTTWQLTNMTNNYSMNVYIVASNSVLASDRYLLIAGQEQYSSLELAGSEAFSDLTLGVLPSAELAPLYKVTISYRTTYTDNDARIRVRAVADLRGTSNPSIRAGAAVEHNNLTGLQGGIAAEYYHLSSAQHTIATQAATTSLSGYLTSTDWNTFNGKQADVITTRGDIIRGSAGAAAERLPIGTSGYVLTSDGTDAAWAASTGGSAASDIPYDSTTWDANTDAATKNVIRDKIETMDTAIGLNTAKVTNVTTNLSEGTATETTVNVNSSDGTNATLVSASTTRAGVLTKAKFDEIVVNTAKVISDTAYDATTWDANTDAATKNAIRDKLDAMDTSIGGKQADVITTRGDIIRGSIGAVAERLAIGASGYVLTSDGTDAAWAAATGGLSDPLTTRGDIIYRDATSTTRLPIGTAAQVLTSDGTDVAWANNAAGFSDPMTTRGDLIFKNSAGTTTRLPAGTASQVLTSDGTDIAWAAGGSGGDPLFDAARNTWVGDTALDSVTTGIRNTGIGYAALTAVTTGQYNTGLGYTIMPVLTSGSYNSAFGQGCLNSVSTSSSNTGFGHNTLALYTGASATGLGDGALASNVSGFSLTAVGASALASSTGNWNTSVGSTSLTNIVSGNSNSALGYKAGSFITGGATANTSATNSIFVGVDARAGAAGQTNQIVIGYRAEGGGTNTATIGSTSTTDNYFYGDTHTTGSMQVGDNTDTASAANVGSMRYRATANDSYCEMSMQTGAATYAWVVIQTNTW